MELSELAWQAMPLKELFVHVIGGDWGKDEDFDEEGFVNVSCIRGSEFKNWKTDFGSTAVTRKIKSSSLVTRELIRGDILIEISGGGPEQPVGRTVLITEKVLKNLPYPPVCTNFLRLARPSQHVNSAYLNYFLAKFYMSGEVVNYQGGSNNLRNLKFKEYETIEVPLPPLAEQKVIAEKLDTLLAQVDNTKARLERIPEILKRFRQSVLAAAVSGKLTKDFFCDSELEDDITEDWIAYQKKIFETIGKQPKSKNWMKSAPKPENRCEFADRLPAGKGWRIFFLDDIIFSKNQGVNTTTEKVEYTSSGIVAIQAGNIQEGYVHFQTDKFVSTEKFESLSAHVKPKSNDVLYTNIGANFGNAAVVPSEVDSFLITWNVMRIVPSRLIMPKYLEMVLNSKIIRDEALKAVSTSTVPFVNGKTIGQYVIPTPQIPEQVEIVRRVEELFAFADRIEHAAQAALGRVNNLTQSILTKAFRGELTADWRAANPDLISGENSAEALLARIKAERAKVKARKKA